MNKESSFKPIEPLQLKARLATSKGLKPKWKATIQLESGKSLDIADPKATRALLGLMDTEALLGGASSHYGGSAAFAELLSVLHGLMFSQAEEKGLEWHDYFHFVNDAGHCENGIYALKANYGMAGLTLDSLKKFRSLGSPLTGHGEAHLFPEGILVSNGPLGSGLPQAQGLAVGEAMRGRFDRVTVCAVSDGGAMEGEAREAFAAIPGLAQKGRLAPFIMILSDNQKKVHGKIADDSFNMEPSFESFATLGWKVIKVENGHSLQECTKALEEAISLSRKNPKEPVFIHAKTVKGKGYRSAENSYSGAHGFMLKSAKDLSPFLAEVYEGADLPEEFLKWCEEVQAKENRIQEEKANKVAATVLPTAAGAKLLKLYPAGKIQAGIGKAMIEAKEKGLPVVAVSSDLRGSTGTDSFHKAYPESSMDVGIAEANMISTGAGLSNLGFIPVVDTFAQFGATKGALPITMANLSLSPIIGIFSHTGFQDAADGASHQALSFLAQVSSIPQVEVFSLSTADEAYDLLTEAIHDFAEKRRRGEVPPTRLFFLGRENFPQRLIAEGVRYKLGQWPVLLDTTSGMQRSVTIAAAGSLVPDALRAADRLLEKEIGAIVFHGSSVNRPDIAAVGAALNRTKGCLITVEDHRVVGGMGAILTHALVEAKEGWEPGRPDLILHTMGVGNHFGQSAYQSKELYRKFSLDAEAIEKAATEIVTR